MGTVYIGGTLTQNEAILHSVSMDSVSGIQTVVDSLNTPGTIMVTEMVPTSEVETTAVVKNLPSTIVTPIPVSNPGAISPLTNRVISKVESLSSKDKNIIIAGLLVLSAILILIAIFK